MIAKIDRRHGYVIFKVTAPKDARLIAYRTLPEGVHDATKARDFQTLSEARSWLESLAVFNSPATA